jgi:hypothetical protein
MRASTPKIALHTRTAAPVQCGMRYSIHCRAMPGVAQRIAGLSPVFRNPTGLVLVQQKWCGQFRSAGSFTLGNTKVCTCGSPAGVAFGVDACLLMRSHPLNSVWPSRSGSQSTSSTRTDQGKRVDSSFSKLYGPRTADKEEEAGGLLARLFYRHHISKISRVLHVSNTPHRVDI